MINRYLTLKYNQVIDVHKDFDKLIHDHIASNVYVIVSVRVSTSQCLYDHVASHVYVLVSVRVSTAQYRTSLLVTAERVTINDHSFCVVVTT